jgi:hypothetical protein
MSENTSPEMEMAQPVVENATPTSPVMQGNPLFKKLANWKTLLGGALGIGLVAFAGYFVYANYFMSPERMLKEAFEKMDVDSIKLGFQAEAEDVDVTGEMIAHEEGYSSMDFTIALEEQGMTHEFDLNFIVDMENMYFQMDYSFMNMLLLQADQMIPGISSTNTFALLKPVITGQSWMHMDIPEEDQAPDAEEYLEEWEEFGEKFADAIVIKDLQRKTMYEGNKYHIISMGVDKEELLEAIDAIKDLDIETEVSDINNIKKAIEDMGELKETLAVAYIDMSGYLRMIDIYAPQGTSDSFQEVIDQEAGTKSPLLSQFSQLTTLFQPDKGVEEGESIKFMTMTFDDYGSAERVSPPDDVVEFEDILLYVESEFAPLFYQYMMMQQGAAQGMPGQAVDYPSSQTYPPQAMPGSAGSMGGEMPINFMDMLQ